MPALSFTKTFGGGDYVAPDFRWDEAWSVQQTADGGYVIAGSTESYGAGGYDAYLVKIDEEGN
ncbi:MAG: hypothetical protein QGG79_00175 [Dehalococcoidales bacterium]|nr:hypothetical protein [Dehalococcoidales bacterium]MDP7285560.1 hypothetical protein [Dehalococcoidales bacterium]